MPLIITEMARSKELTDELPPMKDDANKEITYGARGASMAKPAMRQATVAINDHS